MTAQMAMGFNLVFKGLSCIFWKIRREIFLRVYKKGVINFYFLNRQNNIMKYTKVSVSFTLHIGLVP
jgi:hypothetical protein